MRSPDPLQLTWEGRRVLVRHDDPRLAPYGPRAQVIRAAAEAVSDVEGLRLAPTSALGDHYTVKVAGDGRIVGLRRR